MWVKQRIGRLSRSLYMSKSVIAWLSRTLPFRQELRSYGSFVVAFGLYLIVFLCLYKPFFIAELKGVELWSVVLLIAFFTGLLMMLAYLLAIHRLKTHLGSWTYAKEIIWVLSHFAVVGVYLVVLVRVFTSFDIPGWQLLLQAALVGIIPVIVDVVVRSQWKTHTEPAEVLYVKSDGNYLHVFQNSGENTVREVVRSPLHQFLKRHPNSMVQVHKSYLVNATAISRVSGNSNGGLLVLHDDSHVPYSRSFYPVVKRIAS